MSFVGKVLEQRKLILTLTVLLAGLGLLSWLTMVRQEDPRLRERFGQVQAIFVGADAETVERLVVEPIEEHLAQVDEIELVGSTANAELALIEIDLRQDTLDTDAAWDEVREALVEARRDLPEGVSEPVLNDDVMDTDSVVLALTGHPDPLALKRAAKELKDAILSVEGVARVELVADPGEQITIELDDSAARRLGLSPGALAAQLGERSRIVPGGSVVVAGQTVRLRPQSDFRSVDEIRQTAILLTGGDTVPLASIAKVRLGPEEPARSLARFEGERMVGLGVVPRKSINLVRFGEAVRERVAAATPGLAPIEVRELAYQPARVANRLSDLSRSLVLGAMIVAGVLVLSMGLRMGLIVTSVVPLVALSSLAIYNTAGGVLHQISIAALVIALGMLVDNGIVVSEAMQWAIDRGVSAAEAARQAVAELAVPLAGATATTLAAFVPMLLAEGTTAEFTRAIPVVIMLTLAVSFVFAMMVTPTLGRMFLRPRRRKREGGSRVAEWLGRTATGRPLLVLLAAVLAVGGSLWTARWVRMEFFPGSDRNQLVVEVRLAEGRHLDSTDAAVRQLEQALGERPEVETVASFAGRSAPRFYYNLSQIPWSPHFGQLVVTTTSTGAVPEVVRWVRDYAACDLPEAEVAVRTLEQGPPVDAPVELRIFGDDFDELYGAVEVVMAELRAVPGAVDVRHDLSVGSPLLRFEIDDAAAARRGLSRTDVAAALFGRTRGLPVGQYRADDDPIPVVLRSSAGESLPVSELPGIDVVAPGHAPVPLAQVARVEVDWRPAVIRHHDRRRMARVMSQLDAGYTYSDVLAVLEPRLPELPLPDGVEVSVGGAAQESGQANQAIIRTVPIGVLLLLGILMAEFRSFRRVGIVLTTVPLAAAGVVPGLLLSGQPFGFMSLLGIAALVGVVVNNAIVLLEVIEGRRGEGVGLRQAVRDAVARRMRPILLTTATTVAGLLPLALSPTTLWPPLAWAMISGLTASTFLTLLVVPALYLLLFEPRTIFRRPAGRRVVVAAGMGLVALIAVAPPVAGQEETSTSQAAAESTLAEPASTEERGPRVAESAVSLSLEEAMAMAADSPLSRAAAHRAKAARYGARAEARPAYLPSVLTEGSVTERDRTLNLVTPIGSFPFGAARDEAAQITVAQPLLDPERLFYRRPAARAEARSAELVAYRAREEAAARAAELFLDVLSIDAAARTTESFVGSLEVSLAEARARVEAGRALEADALKVQLALDAARQDLLALAERRLTVARELGRAVGVDTPIEPAWSAPESPAEAPPWAVSVDRAVASRPDLVALEERIRALELRRKAVKAEALPRLSADATWVWSSGSAFEESNWVEGALRVKWNPLAAATRGPRAAAVEEETLALVSELTEARRGVEVEVRAALSDWQTARGALSVGESGVVQAGETLRVEQERFRYGRVTTNDLLEAQAALRQERTRRDIASLEIVRASVRLDLATGDLAGKLPAADVED